MVPVPRMSPRRSVLILTALPEERDAVLTHLLNVQQAWHETGTPYWSGDFGDVWTVRVFETGPNNVNATRISERALASFDAELALFVGIAGGVKDVALYDVVAASYIHGYEGGKSEAEAIMARPDGGPTSARLCSLAKVAAMRHTWLERLVDRDPSNAPRVFIAPIASGEQVVASRESDLYRFIRENYNNALAVEMEALGFLSATHDREVRSIVIRGISDLVDDKGESDAHGSHEIAAQHAAAFAFELLAQYAPLSDQSRLSRTVSTAIAVPRRIPTVPSDYVRRTTVQATIASLVLDHYVVTLTGLGGIGKTSLALAVTWDLLMHFPDGAWFVSLEALSDGDLIVSEIMQRVGVSEQTDMTPFEALSEYLASRHALLVLDNCEHLASACELLIENLHAACPSLRIVATSRHALAVRGQEYPVPFMDVPDPDAIPDVSTLATIESVALFTTVATRRKPHWTLTEANAKYVVRICYHLNGIPLAIELAAARVKYLSPEEIAKEVTIRISQDLVSGGSGPERQRSMWATLDWSWQLLNPREQILLGRLAVFRGGFTWEAARAVGIGDPISSNTIRSIIFSLIDKSLIISQHQSGESGDPMIRLLEPVRQYAEARLNEGHEGTIVRHRHMAFYGDFAERADRSIDRSDGYRWLARFEDAHDNIRAAIRWALRKGEFKAAFRIGIKTGSFWDTRGYYHEGVYWMELIIRGLGDAISSDERIRGYSRLSRLNGQQGNYDIAIEYSRLQLEISRSIKDKGGIVNALRNIAMYAARLGDYNLAHFSLEECESILGDRAHGRLLLSHLNSKGILAMREGFSDEARRKFEECKAESERIGSEGGIASALVNLGFVAERTGDYLAAYRYYEESTKRSKLRGAKSEIATCLDDFASLVRRWGAWEVAATLLGAADRLRLDIGFRRDLFEAADYLRLVKVLKGAIPDRYDAAYAQGQAMSLDDAIELACTPPQDDTSH